MVLLKRWGYYWITPQVSSRCHRQKKKFKDIMSSPTKPTERVVPYQPTEIVVSNLSHKEMKILSTRLTRLMAENKTLALKVEYLEKSLSIWKEVG